MNISINLIIISVVMLFGIVKTSTAKYQPITYGYKTEINDNNEYDFELPSQLEDLAKKLYPQLNSSLFFNTTFIQQAKNVRQWHTNRLNGQIFNAITQDGVAIPCTFFDRNSDHLIVIGPGFTNNRELMSPFLSMFEDADVVLFDFRGHGYEAAPTPFFGTSLSKHLFGADANQLTFGKKEELDVLAVVSHIKKLKPNPEYKTYGIGACYGAFVFLKTAARYPNLFNKLVLDGCWLSLGVFLEKLKKDPRLICVPQEGGWANSWLINNPLTQGSLEPLARHVFHFDLSDISIIDVIEANKKNLQNLDVLFFQGKNDLVVLRNEFEQFWHALPTKHKTAIITSNPHIKNHWKQKELYALSCDLFFDLPHQAFIDAMRTPPIACQHMITKIQGKLGPFLTTTHN